MQSPVLLTGNKSIDNRGSVSYINTFDFTDVKRFYLVENADTTIIRAFHGHMKEAKYMYVVSGRALICYVHLDDAIIDLGFMPLAGGFLKIKAQIKKEKVYPLTFYLCPSCFLLQCNVSIPPDTLFKDYFYFSSSIKSLVTHFALQAEKLSKIFQNP